MRDSNLTLPHDIGPCRDLQEVITICLPGIVIIVAGIAGAFVALAQYADRAHNQSVSTPLLLVLLLTLTLSPLLPLLQNIRRLNN